MGNYSGFRVTLGLHVPRRYILWPQRTYTGTALRLKYIPLGYMDL